MEQVLSCIASEIEHLQHRGYSVDGSQNLGAELSKVSLK